MTSKKFQTLDYHQKLRVVYFKGKEIDFQLSRFGDLQSFTCYSIDDFFVELVYDYKSDKIIKIEPLDDDKSLHRYTYFIPNITRDILNNVDNGSNDNSK